MDINPIEIGIILTGAIEDGFLFEADSLELDTDGIRSDIITATSGAFNLACNIRWFSSQTMPTLLAKASGEATSVAVEAGITNDVTIPLFITRATARALALAGQLDSWVRWTRRPLRLKKIGEKKWNMYMLQCYCTPQRRISMKTALARF